MRKPPTPKPWTRSNPKPRAARTTLTPEQVEEARARAEAAGRRYPNLVDNMWAAEKARRERDAAKRHGQRRRAGTMRAAGTKTATERCSPARP